MKPVLIVIAQDGFQDHELGPVRDALEDAGFEIVLASSEPGECRGKYGGIEQADVAMKDVNVHAYDRIVFIGGPGAGVLRDDPHALRIAKETAEAGIILGAICIAPTILAAAGVLKGVRATVWNSDGAQGSYIIERGAQYTGDSVTVDGRIITGDGPDSAQEFAEVFAQAN